MRRKDIAIVGLGCVFPGAHDAREYWSNIVNGVDCVTDRPAHRLRTARNFDLPQDHIAYLPTSRGGFLPADLSLDPLKYGILPNSIKEGDPDQFLMLKVIDDALHDAGISETDARRARTDVIIGRGGYPTYRLNQLAFGVEWYDATLEMLQRKYPHALTADLRRDAELFLRSTLPENNPVTLSTAIPNITASRAANRLNLGGTAHTVDAACASSLVAVEQAVDRLRSGRADVAIAGGFFLTQWLCFAYLFQSLGAISPTGIIRPMDRRADGLLISEGGGAIVLKRLEDAVEDGDRIYAILKGIGTSSDGRETDVLAPSSGGQVRALERAYDDAEVDRNSIGYLELHGTGTHAGDLAEIASLKQFFGTLPHPPTSRAMGSVKSMIGHAMPASGIASLIRVAMSLSNKVLPPTLNCEQPHPDLEGSPFYINPHTRSWIQGAASGPRRAGVNSFGFGGTNVHAVLEEVLPPKKVGRTRKLQPRPIEMMVHRPTEIALFSASDPLALKRQLQQLLTYLDEDVSSPTVADVAAALARQIDLKQPCKLALIAADLAELRSHLESCCQALETSEPKFPNEQIYYSSHAAKHAGKVAFIFPGMGFPGLIGNYPDHLLELCLHDPEVRSEFDYFEERDRHPEDYVPTSSIFSPPASLPEEYRQRLKNRLAPPKTDSEHMYQHRPEERYLAAMGVTLANWIGWTMLKTLEIPADMVTGQSQGEMAAVCAAGVCDFRATAPAYWRALNVNPNYSARGRMAFVWAKPEVVEPLLESKKESYIAIYLTPEALILGGDREELTDIVATLKKDGCFCQVLPYPPIHTPCMSYLIPEFDAALADMEISMQKPKIALYSSITASLYPSEPKAIRETMNYNLDKPLRNWQTLRRMYDDGARIFVQVGGGQTAGYLKDLLPPDDSVVSVALETDTRNPITQLNHLVAGMFTAGVPMNPLPLFDHRRIRALDLASPQTKLPAPRLLIPVRFEWSPLASPNVPPAPETPTPDTADNTPVEPEHSQELPAISASDTAAASPPADDSSSSQAAFETSEPLPQIEWDRSLPVIGLHGQVVRYVPEQEIVIHRPLNFEQDLYLCDHTFVNAPQRHIRENLAVVPMTMTMELIAEAAALLCPGLGLIGYETLRAIRWISLDGVDETMLVITARFVGDDADTGIRRVETIVEYEDKRAFSATVLFADSYRHDLKLELPDMSGDGAWPFPMDDLYEMRRCFHGPRFQTLVSLDSCGPETAQTTLIVPPKDDLFQDVPEPTLLIDPCLFDACGQTVGLFCQLFDRCVLPAAVDRIEIYSATPPVGTRCPMWLHLTEMNAETNVMRCNIILGDGAGGVWAQFEGWTDWMFYWSKELYDFLRRPDLYVLSSEVQLPEVPADAVCAWLKRDDVTMLKFDWFPRTALTRAELDELRTFPKKSMQQRFIMSRLAAKDAVRIWEYRQTGERLRLPVELELTHDAQGRPFLNTQSEAVMPHISISHSGDIAVALASSVPVGIDLEQADRDLSSILLEFTTDEERAALETLDSEFSEGAWSVRLWCAKEAASKVLGTGLQGAPKEFQMIEADGEGRITIFHAETGRAFTVTTCFHGPWVIAVGRDAEPVTESLMEWPTAAATD